jgi:hypothetical protein
MEPGTVSTRPPTYTPIPTGQEAIDRNLRLIQDAFKLIAQASAPAAQAYQFLGFLTSDGSIAIPAGAKRIDVMLAGDAAAAGKMSVTVDAIAAGYIYETNIPAIPSYAVAGPVASWVPYGGGGGGSFSCDFSVSHGAGAAAQTYFRGGGLDASNGGFTSDGRVPAANAPTKLNFAATSLTSWRASVWAAFEA